MVKPHRRQLSQDDIDKMTGVSDSVSGGVRVKIIIKPQPPARTPSPVLDLHGMTEDDAWNAIVKLWDELQNNEKIKMRTITIITGASGILKQKFPVWMTESAISDRIQSHRAINNGSWSVVVRKI